MKYKNNKNSILVAGIFLNFVFFASNIYAVDIDYSLFSTYRYSDNLAQNNSELSGTALNSGATFDITNEGNNVWTFDLSGTISKEWYSIDNLETQDRNQASASLEYMSPSSNFEFLLRDDYSQAPRDRFALTEVDNLIDVNIITARPSYFFNLTPLNLINLEVTYVELTREGEDDTTIGQESFDFINLSKEIRYEKIINSSSDISLVLDSVTTEFSGDSALGDFTQDNLFLRWVARGRFNQVQLEFGRSRVSNGTEEDIETEYYNATYTRQINSTSSLNFNYNDSVNIVARESFIDNSVNVDDQIGTFGNAQKVKSYNLTYSLTGDSLSGTVFINQARYRELNGGNSEKRSGGAINFTYSLSQYFSTAPQTNINFVYRNNRNTFNGSNDLSTGNKVESYSLQFNYFAKASLSYFIEVLVRNAESTRINSAFLNGDSSTVSIGFNYSPVVIR